MDSGHGYTKMGSGSKIFVDNSIFMQSVNDPKRQNLRYNRQYYSCKSGVDQKRNLTIVVYKMSAVVKRLDICPTAW